MIQDVVIRIEDENESVVKKIKKMCEKIAKDNGLEFYIKEIQSKNMKYLDLTKVPKDKKDQFFERG